jgi:hypothetical protein
MADNSDLGDAFDAALAATRRERSAGMTCADGSSAAANLNQLERELVEARQYALQRGMVDIEWFQKTVRWLVDWVPETELTLIAALGQIARANPSTSA